METLAFEIWNTDLLNFIADFMCNLRRNNYSINASLYTDRTIATVLINFEIRFVFNSKEDKSR